MNAATSLTSEFSIQSKARVAGVGLTVTVLRNIPDQEAQFRLNTKEMI